MNLNFNIFKIAVRTTYHGDAYVINKWSNLSIILVKIVSIYNNIMI